MLAKAMPLLGLHAAAEEIDSLFASLNPDRSHALDYREVAQRSVA
jgi:hypothetical protein